MVAELEPIVRRLREAWLQVRIVVRGDSAFSNDELMVWCEEEGIDYVLGLAKNDRLKRRIATLKVSRFRGRFISVVDVGLDCNTPSVGGERGFRLPKVNDRRECQGCAH